jgi:mannose-1-phosphate guanylyltransferase
MAGGQSTRFWPLGRRRVPKQFLTLSGRASLLQAAARRLVPLVSWNRILVVTAAEHAAEARRQLPRVPAAHILVEPVGRNTAACIALAAEWITAHHGDALMLIVPADHVIEDAGALRRSLRAAAQLALREGALVLLGMRPTRAETGYGYIELGQTIGSGAFQIRRFREKPPRALARRFVAGGRHLWNSGMFVWKASVFRRALLRCLPEIDRALRGVWRGRDGQARLRRVYRRLPSISVDSGILQPLSALRTEREPLLAMHANFHWLDVGSWGALADLWGCDEHGNATRTRLLPIESSHCIVYAPDRLVVLLGVSNLIVADSGGALLICERGRSQDVRVVPRVLEQHGCRMYV